MPKLTTDFNQRTVALVYDFDGTLSPQAMQEYGVLPSLDIEPSDFWRSVKTKRKALGAEELLVYMREMVQLADQKQIRLDREAFQSHVASIEFFEGVPEWFDRIDQFSHQLSDGEVAVEHYIISSGLKEMIEGCSIAPKFREIFACEFLYDQYGHPQWPGRIISDTSKTQYLFRINKGVLDVNDSINSHMPFRDRPIPFDNMIYFGDGDTDVPSMAVTMANGGHAIAVHKPGASSEKCITLREAGRIDLFCEADYRPNSDLDSMVKDILRVVVSRVTLRSKIANIGQML